MESYSEFAYVYDIFMDETPYAEWKDYIVDILKEHNISDGLVLDLGCGTGTLTRMLKDDGYDMIGIDASYDMLNVARAKSCSDVEEEADDNSILYLCQDMRQFELYGTVRAIISVCDCVNYLTSDEDVIQTFRLVNNYLDRDGIFIFDFNTVHKYRDVIGDRVIAENRDDCSFIWNNYYDADSRINEYELSLFIKLEDEDNLYERCDEQHLQKGYEYSDMLRLLDEAGLDFVKAFDTDTKNAPDNNSQRITIVAKERLTEGKLYI